MENETPANPRQPQTAAPADLGGSWIEDSEHVAVGHPARGSKRVEPPRCEAEFAPALVSGIRFGLRGLLGRPRHDDWNLPTGQIRVQSNAAPLLARDLRSMTALPYEVLRPALLPLGLALLLLAEGCPRKS